MKYCSRCKIEKSEDKFASTGTWCIKCGREYYKENKKKILEKKKKYYKNNKKDCLKYKNAVEYIPVSFYTYANQLSIDEEPINKNNILSCMCFKCKKYFTPTKAQVLSRIDAINGKCKSLRCENHIYCSEKCKQNCDIFHQSTRRKSQIPLHTKARCNQHTNKKALLGSQIDKYNHTFCEKCGLKTEKLAIHHNIMVSKDFTEADNVAHQILVCDNCHIHEDC